MMSQLQPSPSRRRLFKLLTVALSLGLCLVCLEVGLRTWGPEYHRFNAKADYYSNPRGYFDIRRLEGDQVLYGIDIFVSRAGTLPPVRVPDGPLSDEEMHAYLFRDNSILALGDSFTIGQGVKFEDLYLTQLEKKLELEGLTVHVKNTAVQGYDLQDISEVYDDFAALQHYPLVIYGFVLNDFGLPGIERLVGWDYITINNQNYNALRKHSAVVNFVCHSLETIHRTRVTQKAYLHAFQGAWAEDGFKLLGDLNRRIAEDDSQLVIVLFPLLDDFEHYAFGSIHDRIRQFCDQEKIPLLDLLPALSQYDAQTLWVHPTDRHPNEIAHRIAAEEIHAFLKQHGLLKALDLEQLPSVPSQDARPAETGEAVMSTSTR